jgi:hypothetical protein
LDIITGKSAGYPAGRAATDSSTGVKADPLVIVTLPGSPGLWAGSFPFVSVQEIQRIYEKGGAGENIANLIKTILKRKKIWERYSPWEDMFNYCWGILSKNSLTAGRI